MSVNLVKNKDTLLRAWEEIHNPNGTNDWVIFGYEGLSSDLKVVSQGEDGLEEMVDDFNGGKILYGGLRILDPNTNLPKVVFINWQGEGVPATVKGKCASHLRDITNFFRGFHVQVNARNEDDIEEKTIKDKVKNASGAKFSIHKEKPVMYEPQGPIGSVYQKSKPHLDTGIKEKDEFWKKNQIEEARRKEEEAKQLEEEKMKLSRQRSQREKEETDRRHKEFMERSKSIDEQRNMNLPNTKKSSEDEKRKFKEVMAEAKKDDEEFRLRSEAERKKRLQEANSLIGQRQGSIDGAKSAFETTPARAPPQVAPKKRAAVPLPAKNTRSVPPVVERNQVQGVVPEPVKPTPEPVREPTPEPVREPTPEPVREPTPEPVRQPSPEPVRQPSPEPVRQPSPEPVPQETDDIYDEVPTDDAITTIQQQPISTSNSQAAAEIDSIVLGTPAAASEVPQVITATALYDYQAADASEITFDPGDLITDIEKIDEGWWRGTAPNGHYGMFPSNYVEENTSLGDAPLNNTPLDNTPQPQEKSAEEAVASDQGLCATALYDYQAADESEITFDPGDVITNIEQIDEGWWRGCAPGGQYGLFPANYVELV